MAINHGGNGTPPTLVIGKDSAVHISIYSLLAFLIQTVIITGSVVMVYSNLTTRQTTLESDLNWVRKNQEAYTNYAERLTNGIKEVDLVKRDIETVRSRIQDHDRWTSEIQSKLEYLTTQAIETNVWIRNLHPDSKMIPPVMMTPPKR